MSENTVILLIVGGFALLFWATSTGLLRTTGGAVPVGNTGIVAPQPTANYSGYLAASTAPGVSSALNSIIGGLGTSLSSWLSPSGGNAPVVAQNASPSSPAGAAQPNTTSVPSTPVALVGPQIDPVSGITYQGNTIGSAFDYAGLAGANSYDPNYDLSTPAWA